MKPVFFLFSLVLQKYHPSLIFIWIVSRASRIFFHTYILPLVHFKRGCWLIISLLKHRTGHFNFLLSPSSWIKSRFLRPRAPFFCISLPGFLLYPFKQLNPISWGYMRWEKIHSDTLWSLVPVSTMFPMPPRYENLMQSTSHEATRKGSANCPGHGVFFITSGGSDCWADRTQPGKIMS